MMQKNNRMVISKGSMTVALIVYLVIACIFGLVTKRVNENRGREGGFWWGFFLGVIGIVVVAIRPKD